jgi:hypothetical protein
MSCLSRRLLPGRRLQAESQVELDALLPSLPVLSEVEGLDSAFKGES